jgi:thioredoxin 1
MPIIITKDNFEHEVTQSKLPVVLDVYATWCGPCLQMEPIFEELELEYGNKYKFVKLNVDESRELAINYGVTAVPTFIFIKNNEIKGKETGFQTKAALITKITELLG